MSRTNSNEQTTRYGHVAKLLHWGFVAIFAYGIYKQVDTIEQLEDAALLRFEILFALIFLVLLIIRFFFMRYTYGSALPQDTPQWQKIAAKIVHYGLYASFGSIAATGLLIGTFYAINIKSGLMMTVVVGLHEISVTVSYYLILIHVLAALYHRLLKDGVWSAMVPLWKESENTSS